MMTAAISKKLASQLAPKIKGMTWERARDHIDLATAGELEPWRLDKLTDWTFEEGRRRFGQSEQP